MTATLPETTDWELRRAALIALGLAPEIYGAGALLALASADDPAAANCELRRVAEWFDHPHPHGRDLQGEPDFAAIKLARAWYQFGPPGRLEPETLGAIRGFFLGHDFASIYQSENHALLFHAARYLMGAAFPDESFVSYQDKGAGLRDEDSSWLKKFLRYRAGHGWGEFDSPCYVAPVWECLASLFDFSADADLKHLAGRMMDLVLADFEVDSLKGMYGGAHGRIYPPQALSHANENTPYLHYLYFGGTPPPAVGMQGFMADALTSAYRPHPAIAAIAQNRERPYENRERKHLHNVADVLPHEPLIGSLRKYTYWTPDYVLGCVQLQDDYPDACVHHPHHRGRPVSPEQRNTAGYAHHQQHEWDLSFATRPDARIFTHHPGSDGEHNYWTGDRLCGCGHFFQNRNALIALYNIPAGQAMQWIHAYVPRFAFDEVVEEKGVLFVRAGEACGSLRILSDYHWKQEGEWKDREIIAAGPRHAVVCEAGQAADFGSFAAFRAEISANSVVFERERMELEYRSARAGIMKINTRGGRWLDGKSVDLDCPAFDSPWLRGAWGGNQVEVLDGADRTALTLDFAETKL